jgi:putative oxidoreductase
LISGYHKLFNKQRHASLVETLKASRVPCLGFNQWWVPSVEFFGGLSLLSGILAPLAALGLIVLCFVAVCTDGLKRIPNEQPIDKADWLDDLLYLPEMLYVIGLIIVVGAGPGVTLLDFPQLAGFLGIAGVVGTNYALTAAFLK